MLVIVISSLYYYSCLAKGLVITNLTNMPNIVLSDYDLERTSLEVDYLYIRYIKSLAISTNYVCFYKTYNYYRRYNYS